MTTIPEMPDDAKRRLDDYKPTPPPPKQHIRKGLPRVAELVNELLARGETEIRSYYAYDKLRAAGRAELWTAFKSAEAISRTFSDLLGGHGLQLPQIDKSRNGEGALFSLVKIDEAWCASKNIDLSGGAQS